MGLGDVQNRVEERSDGDVKSREASERKKK